LIERFGCSLKNYVKKFKAGELVTINDSLEVLTVVREIKFSTVREIVVHLRNSSGENVFTERKNLTRVGIC